MNERIYTLKEQIREASENLEQAKKELKKLEEELAKAEKKPVFVTISGQRHVITGYKMYNRAFIEFEVNLHFFRYVLKQRNKYIGNDPLYTGEFMTPTMKGEMVFEEYDNVSGDWIEMNNGDHIELLEGVDEYDQN